MSSTQVVVAGLLLGGFVVAVGTTVLEKFAPRPDPIRVHELSYADGMVKQHRTVTPFTGGDEAILLTWGASVIDAITGDDVPGCVGSGTWPYRAGEHVFNMPLHSWVGSSQCTSGSLPIGTYRLRAVYSRGEWQTVATSPPFGVVR